MRPRSSRARFLRQEFLAPDASLSTTKRSKLSPSPWTVLDSDGRVCANESTQAIVESMRMTYRKVAQSVTKEPCNRAERGIAFDSPKTDSIVPLQNGGAR